MSIIDQLKAGLFFEFSVLPSTLALGNNWSVCLDAAAWVPCSTLNLSTYRADFVAFSFYKLFGFPTGVGALLIRKGQEELLQKRYFGGGTIEAVFPETFNVFYRRSVEQRYSTFGASKFKFDLDLKTEH